MLLACSTTPKGPVFTPYGPVANDKALFYIYRQEVFKDRHALFELLVNGELVADMMNGGYITYLADPGKIEISTRMKSTMMTSMESFLTAEHAAVMEAEAGHSYFMRVNYVDKKHIVPVPEDVGMQEISALHLNPPLVREAAAEK
jgi:hypothetical protein